MAEGANILRDMPANISVAFFAVDEQKATSFCDITDRFNAEVIYVQSEVLNTVCGTKTPQGIIAAIKTPKSDFTLPKANALLLDGISDPGNLGTILRTAAATNFLDVYLLDCADAYSPKTVRASMGGIFRARCYEVGEEQAKSVLKSTTGLALDMNGTPVDKIKPVYPLTLVCGSEACGMRASLKDACKTVVSLPMKNGMESLNAAVALSVVMYSVIDF